MDDTRKKLTGQTADAKYPLLEYLGGSRHSTVFRTGIAPSSTAPSSPSPAAPTKAAIKIMPAASGSAEPQLNRWRQAERLSHPNLVKIYDCGDCHLGDEDFLYVVEEFADEDLSQILPQRALNADETRGMLAATLDALFYLHAKGFVHGHLSPANIMAIGDEVKLSSDGIVRAGERLSDSGRLSPYDPPEAASGRISTAADMWSLGMTLAEVLTQKLPIWERLGREEPRLPESMPQPFADIARRCLQRDAKMRWNVEQVASALSHTLLHHADPPLKARAAVASLASVGAAVAYTLSESAPISESRRASRASESVPKPASVAAPATALPRERPAGRNLGIAAAAIAILVIAILEAPRLLKHDPHAHAASANAAASGSEPASDSASSSSAAQPASGSPTPAPNDTAAAPPAASPNRSAAKAANEKSALATRPAEKIVKSPAPPKPASAAPPKPSSMATASAASSEIASAAITHREIPSVPQRSLATITGTVRVAVRVKVADDGSVSDASFDHEGPSAYFSRISINAARDWKFSPGPPRAWVLHFQFTSSGAKAEATPAAN